MTFNIKKLSTAFVVVSLMVAKVAATEAPAADTTKHDDAVLRATNVFYNLFATNALVAGRISTVGSVTAGSVHVDGDETVNGTLTVNGQVRYDAANGPLYPVGSRENYAQRMVWAKYSPTGGILLASGVTSTSSIGAGDPNFGITWSTPFAVAPTLVVNQVSGTGLFFRHTASTTGAIISRVNSSDFATAGAGAGAFNITAIGS